MKYCKNCLQTDTRPGIKFNNRGICPACANHNELKKVDWDERRKMLESVVCFGKKNNHSVMAVGYGTENGLEYFLV